MHAQWTICICTPGILASRTPRQLATNLSMYYCKIGRSELALRLLKSHWQPCCRPVCGNRIEIAELRQYASGTRKRSAVHVPVPIEVTGQLLRQLK